jgi:hypothetical protein
MRNETLSETFALELMREGKLLMRMHTVNGARWFVVPGGKITDSVAKRILARPDVQPHDNGLFPGCEQTFRLSGDWRAPPRLTASCMRTGKRPHPRSGCSEAGSEAGAGGTGGTAVRRRPAVVCSSLTRNRARRR